MHCLKFSAATALRCLALNPGVSRAPASPGSALRAEGRGVTAHTSSLHCASVGRLLRFWISEESQSPLRVLFPFSVFLLFPSLPLTYRCFTVNFKIHFKSLLCKDRDEAKGGRYIYIKNFISSFSTVNCLHVLQCSLAPNPNQNTAQTKANRTNAL